MSPSCPYQRVAVLATTIDCASIIFPITPPELLAAAIRVGLRPSCVAGIFCTLPNTTLEEVSEPVSATPSHPNIVPKKGHRNPVFGKARPRVAASPQYRVVNPS